MITVIDSPCGFGKTQYMINMINENPTENYVYITPYLNEVKRIKESTKFLDGKLNRFVEPEITSDNLTKMDSLIEHIGASDDIVSTHALFSNCSKELVTTIKENHYTLILDEVMNVVEVLKIRKDDLDMIIDSKRAKVVNSELIWLKEEYDASFNRLKELCMNHHVFIVNGTALIWTFPVEIFEAFDSIYICTYLFDAQIQKYYYDLYSIEYIKKSVVNGELVDYVKQFNNTDKIHVLDNSKLNNIGKDDTALSKSWFCRHKSNLKNVKTNLYNFVHNIAKNISGEKVTSKSIIWSTYKDYQHKLSGKGYSTSFLPFNQRATNEYINTFVIAYMLNVYLNPTIVKYFENNSVKVDQDTYALSELIQFIYRSRIRKGNDIYCYIPSKRMRELLYKYIDDSKNVIDI